MMNNQTNMETEEAPESQGIDGVIALVDSYIQDPKLVTPQTLMDLKTDLMDLKSVLDGEDQEPVDQVEPSAMTQLMGKMKGGMR